MGVLDVLFPRFCMGCGTDGAYVCAECLQQFSPARLAKCPMCEQGSVSGLTHARCRTPWGMDGVSFGFAFRGLLQKLLWKYKFRFVRDLLPDLTELMLSLADFEAVSGKGPMVVTWVPLHPKRLHFRGYNQSELIARALADNWGWEVRELLVRTRETVPQSSLPRTLRQKNMVGAFDLSEDAQVKGERVLLVDDVWTTGSTMRECAKVLKRNGVAMVWGLTLAA